MIWIVMSSWRTVLIPQVGDLWHGGLQWLASLAISGDIAQWLARPLCMRKAPGSNPGISNVFCVFHAPNQWWLVLFHQTWKLSLSFFYLGPNHKTMTIQFRKIYECSLSTLPGKDIELDSVGPKPEFDPNLTARCVSTLLAPLLCNLRCCSWTVVVVKLQRTPAYCWYCNNKASGKHLVSSQPPRPLGFNRETVSEPKAEQRAKSCCTTVGPDSAVLLLWILHKIRSARILDTIVCSGHCFGFFLRSGTPLDSLWLASPVISCSLTLPN